MAGVGAGCTDGTPIGGAVVVRTGVGEGERDGGAERLGVGRGVGLRVGLRVGATVGGRVGDGDGRALGVRDAGGRTGAATVTVPRIPADGDPCVLQ